MTAFLITMTFSYFVTKPKASEGVVPAVRAPRSVCTEDAAPRPLLGGGRPPGVRVITAEMELLFCNVSGSW